MGRTDNTTPVQFYLPSANADEIRRRAEENGGWSAYLRMLIEEDMRKNAHEVDLALKRGGNQRKKGA